MIGQQTVAKLNLSLQIKLIAKFLHNFTSQMNNQNERKLLCYKTEIHHAFRKIKFLIEVY